MDFFISNGIEHYPLRKRLLTYDTLTMIVLADMFVISVIS